MGTDAIVVNKVTKIFNFKRPSKLFGSIRLDTKKDWKKILALDDISFSVSKGELLSIIGLNGSGKTTLLRTIAGIYEPDLGNIQIQGRIAPLLHLGTGFQGELDANDNITMYGMLLGISKLEIKEKIKEILEFADLENFANMKLKHYSTGMRARLAFSTALQVKPDILLVDEILAVGDKLFKEKSFDAFTSFKKQGKTILLSTHSLSRVSELSDRVLLIHQGKLIKIGKPDEVLQMYNEMTKKAKKT